MTNRETATDFGRELSLLIRNQIINLNSPREQYDAEKRELTDLAIGNAVANYVQKLLDDHRYEGAA